MPDILWKYNVKLQGATPNNNTTLSFVIQYDDDPTPLDLGGALSAATQIRGALEAISTANVSKDWLTFVNSTSDTLGTGDVFDEAAVSTFINETGSLPKYHTLRVPAPIAGLFMVDGETVDIDNAALIQYVQQVAQHAFVSDGEQINTALQNGIDSGHKRNRAKSYA